MANPLKLLPTEKLKHRRKELNRSVDRLTRNPQATSRGPWDSEARRLHDGLAKKQKIAQAGRGVAIVVLGIWLGLCFFVQADMIEDVIDALVQVESRGGNVRGLDGEVGILQIKPICLREANRLVGYDRWDLLDRWNPQESRAMARITLVWHFNRGTTDPVELACRWRNPFSECPDWYRNNVRNALEL